MGALTTCIGPGSAEQGIPEVRCMCQVTQTQWRQPGWRTRCRSARQLAWTASSSSGTLPACLCGPPASILRSALLSPPTSMLAGCAAVLLAAGSTFFIAVSAFVRFPNDGLSQWCLQAVVGMELHPSKPLIFTACLDGQLRCWDARNGETLMIRVSSALTAQHLSHNNSFASVNPDALQSSE